MNIRHPHSANRLGLPQMAESQSKEQLVPDERYFYRPSEVVQRKLQTILPGSHIPISSLHLDRLVRR